MFWQVGSRVTRRVGVDVPETSHHNILREFAMLSRSELTTCKAYLREALDAVREDEFALPHRMCVPRLNCFIIMLTQEMAVDPR